MAEVKLKKINKIYGQGPSAVHAVQNLDLDIGDGEFMALLGPSGCGKTSTLRMIVGLETVTSGDILFAGERVNDLDPRHRNVAMAFETYALYPNFTVEENLAFPLEIRGVDPTERKKRAREVAELLRITAILGEKPPSLSGGQQQRVSLGRALIREPAVLILDEVMSHLDAHLKFQMLFELKRLHRELRRTIVYVTHDQVEALALADRVAVMSNARLQQVGNRNELYNAPANIFVADFIGEPPTSFFRARKASDSAGLSLAVEGTSIVLTPAPEREAALAAHKGEWVKVGIRPQNLRLANGTGGASTVAATVVINEYLGERSILTLREGPVEFRALAPPEFKATRGERVHLTYLPRDVLVFDETSEALIR